jgi:hypothetical protein
MATTGGVAMAAAGGGSETFGYSQVSNSPGRPFFRPTPKFDSQKIVHFMGLCEIAPREQYQSAQTPGFGVC